MNALRFSEAERLRRLHASLGERRRPEDVAEMIGEALGSRLPDHELATLERAARGSLKRRLFGYTSMAEDFARPAGLDRQIRTTMIVRRGMDSSTWNNTTGAWNRARDHWVALLYALGLEAVLDACCPGKVMRIMAADLAYLHRRYRSGIDPNTEVWAELPLPWQVLAGEASCTREQVEAVCRKVGLDPQKSGWTAPRERARVAAFRPTPELVHGVAVSSPVLAKVLRTMGVFSGKSLKVGAESVQLPKSDQ